MTGEAGGRKNFLPPPTRTQVWRSLNLLTTALSPVSYYHILILHYIIYTFTNINSDFLEVIHWLLRIFPEYRTARRERRRKREQLCIRFGGNSNHNEAFRILRDY